MMRAPWYIAGPLLGLVIVALRAAVNKPFGISSGYHEIVQHVTRPERLGLRAFILVGVVAGGALYALTLGRGVPPGLSYSAAGGVLPSGTLLQYPVLLLAGLAMGFGARTAGGCTSGHGLTGTSLGSPASLLATMTFFATAVALAHLLTWL
ncbi:MAG: YeeE/YedE family protein [Acidobacteria bacterium]|nr:YeeE/YedE family protein [Acidobacteriota bacterium]